MNERIVPGAKGLPTLYLGGRALHSRYDPVGEAERYVDSLGLSREPQVFILIEPGLGYILPPLRRRFPAAKMVALHASPFFNQYNQAEKKAGAAVWTPGGRNLQKFLEGEIPDMEASGLKVLEWRPALAVYGRAYADLLEETLVFIKRIDANARTTRGFGRRWVRNFLKNLGLLRQLLYRPQGLPVSNRPWIVTGAGPSLEASLPRIRELCAGPDPAVVLAASSSVPALAAGGISPEMVITSDGGIWALFHLYELFRRGGRPPFLAASLSAALPSQCAALPILAVADGSRWQRLVLEELGIPHINLPQRGTVTAAALDLALALTSGPVFLAGMDLGNRDIRTHARPYGFERLQWEAASRLRPRYSQGFVRARDMAAGGSGGIYADWFRGRIDSYPRRLYSLGQNSPAFDGLEAAEPLAVALPVSPASPGPFSSAFSILDRQVPEGSEGRARNILRSHLTGADESGTLCGELGALLLPGEAVPKPERLAAELDGLGG